MFTASLPPATKLGQGYVFTGLGDSVHRGGCLPQCMLGYHTPQSRHPQKQTPPGGRPPLEQTPQGADTPLGADTPPWSRPPQEQTPSPCRKQTHTPRSRHTPPPEQTPPIADTPRADTPPCDRACWEIRSTRGRYASCRNAILFKVCLCVHRLRFDLARAPWRVNN